MIARELRHFLLLAQHRHFGRAALALRLTQPALSKSIRRLEDIYGARLLERGRNGAVLTRAGELVLKHARLAEREFSLAAEALGAVKRGDDGEVVVGAAISMAHHLLPMATSRFLKQHSNARVRVVTGLNDTLFISLQRGDVDFVVCAYPLPPQWNDLVHENLFSDEVNVVARWGHPLTRHRQRSLKAFLGYRWVLYGTEVLSTQYLQAAFISAGLNPPTPTIESNSADYNKSVLVNTDFLGYLPYEVFRAEHQVEKLVPLPITKLTWKRRIGITYRRGGSLPPAAEAFANEVKMVSALIRNEKQPKSYRRSTDRKKSATNRSNSSGVSK